MRGLLTQGRANWWLPRLTAFQSHDAFVPHRLPQHICASAARAHLCNGTAACLPWSASQCPTMEASVRRPPIVRSRWEWEARHGSGPGPVCEAPDQAFSQAETTESLLSERPLGLRHERGTERRVLGTGGDSLPVGNESAVTPLSSSFVHLSLKVDLPLIFLWRAVTNVPYIEGPVVLCIVGNNNSGFQLIINLIIVTRDCAAR